MTVQTLVYTCPTCGEYSAYTIGDKTQLCSNCKTRTASSRCKTTKAVHNFGNVWMISGGDGVVTVTSLPNVKLPKKHQLHEDMADANTYAVEPEDRRELKQKFLKTAEERGLRPMFTPANETPMIHVELLSKEQYDMLLANGTLKTLMNETRTYEEFHGIKVQLTAEQTMDKLSQAFMKFSISLIHSQCQPGTETCEKLCRDFIQKDISSILTEYGFEMALNSNK